MNKIILFLSGLLTFSTASFAKCAYTGIYPVQSNTVQDCKSGNIFSTSPVPTVHKNSVIILEFYGASQELVAGLGTSYPIYLRAGNETVKLETKEILKGEFQLTQVVFKPAKELTEGQRYELFIDKLPKHQEAPRLYNAGTGKWDPISFNVTPGTNLGSLVFKEDPREVKKTMCRYGCGPAKWVYFELAPENNTDIYVRAYVKNMTTGKTTEYLLAVENNMVRVGHGMCSGAFRYDPENLYEISFLLMDHAGNNSQKTAGIILKQPDTFTAEE